MAYMNNIISKVKLPRSTCRVKNKTPADVQITAEQIVREARQHHEEIDQNQQPNSKIVDDLKELEDYRLRKRKEFEDIIRRARYNKKVWIKYAKWEESHKDFDRARSVWERILDVDYKDHTIWLKYADFEIRNKFVNHARNVLDRAVTLLPRVDELWRKYIRMEQTLGNDDQVRVVSERWMTWKPMCDQVPDDDAEDIIECGGVVDDDDDVFVRKRRFEYDQQVRKNPLNYDFWFDYIRLEESVGNKERIREAYEIAIANVPPAKEKRYWQRYIYLWIGYALYEELDAQEVTRAREVLSECLKVIPHKKFTFGKIWLMASDLEVRQMNLSRARAILGKAIGVAPKHKIFRKYIDMELLLGNIDRCRKLYEKYLEWSPDQCHVWIKFVEFEKSLNETERVRAIFELAVAQPALDKPELLWKAYIDFEISKGEFVKARVIYERLLDHTKHLKVWISYAMFEASAIEKVQQEQKQVCIQRARRVFEKAINYYRTSAPELQEERVMLLEEWLKMERSFDELGDIELVNIKLLKKRRQIHLNDGNCRYEAFTDYLFPEDSQASNYKLLEQAYKWKKQKIASN